MNICKSLSLVIVFFCISCDKPLPVLEGIRSEDWTRDKNGCSNVRATMRDAIVREKEKLLALDQMEVVKLLGKPDQNELSKRNQKFFYYFIRPSPSCPGAGDSLAERLAIRFNAVGLAKEVAIERGKD